MTNRFTCTLNGQGLEALDEAIRVTDLTELSPRYRMVTTPVLGGMRMLSRVRESLTVRISMLIAEYDPARRRATLSKVNRWAARGGWLTVSDRPGQRLRVDYCTVPVMSALGWSDEIQLECTALTTPYWEEAEEHRAAASSDDDGALTPGGTAESCPVHVDVRNNGEDDLTTLTIACGDTAMTFTGLQVSPGGMVNIAVTGGVLTAWAEGASILPRRTADSADLLLARCGQGNAVSVSGDQPVSAIFRARGRFA